MREYANAALCSLSQNQSKQELKFAETEGEVLMITVKHGVSGLGRQVWSVRRRGV